MTSYFQDERIKVVNPDPDQTDYKKGRKGVLRQEVSAIREAEDYQRGVDHKPNQEDDGFWYVDIGKDKDVLMHEFEFVSVEIVEQVKEDELYDYRPHLLDHDQFCMRVGRPLQRKRRFKKLQRLVSHTEGGMDVNWSLVSGEDMYKQVKFLTNFLTNINDGLRDIKRATRDGDGKYWCGSYDETIDRMHVISSMVDTLLPREYRK